MRRKTRLAFDARNDLPADLAAPDPAGADVDQPMVPGVVRAVHPLRMREGGVSA